METPKPKKKTMIIVKCKAENKNMKKLLQHIDYPQPHQGPNIPTLFKANI